MPRPLNALIALTFLAAGCSSWEDQRYREYPAWADDDQEIAYVFSEYQFKENWIVSGGDVRNESYHVRLTDPDLTDDRAVTPAYEGAVEVLYDMRRAGYRVAGSESGAFHVLDLAGAVLRTFEPADGELCDHNIMDFQRIHVVPSLDGERLAVLETGSDCAVTVSFRNAASFAPEGSFSLDSYDFVRVAWIRPGLLLVETCRDTCGDGVWLVDMIHGVHSLPDDDDYEACFFVATSSSWVDARGRAVYVDWDAEELRVADIHTLPPEEFGLPEITADHYTPGCAQLENWTPGA